MSPLTMRLMREHKHRLSKSVGRKRYQEPYTGDGFSVLKSFKGWLRFIPCMGCGGDERDCQGTCVI
jgi:hypothetical protein